MKKTVYINFRCTPEIKEGIKDRAKKGGYSSVSDFLYSQATSGLIKEERILLYKAINEMRTRNAMAENNINQIAKHVNTFKNINDNLMEKFLEDWNIFIETRIEQNILIEKLINKL